MKMQANQHLSSQLNAQKGATTILVLEVYHSANRYLHSTAQSDLLILYSKDYPTKTYL